MIVDELITLIGIRQDSRNASEMGAFNRGVAGVMSSAVKLGAALTAAAGAFSAYAVAISSTIDAQGKLSESIGVTFEHLQELGYAATISGGSIDDIAADLKNLNNTMSSPIPGEYNETLLMLGVSARKAGGGLKSADEVLLDLSDKFKNFNAQKATQFGEKLGLSDGTIRLLREGRDGISKLTQQARDLGGVLSEDVAAKSAALNDSLFMLRFSFKGVADTVATSLFPVFTDISKAVTDFIVDNKKWISLGIEQVIKGVGKGFDLFLTAVKSAADFVSQFLPDLTGLTQGLDATNFIAVAVAAALVALAAAAASMAAPFVAAGAAIAGATLIVEDFLAYINDAPSVIGRLVDSVTERFPNIARVIGKTFNAVVDMAKAAFGIVVDKIKWLLGAVAQVGKALGIEILEGLDKLDASLAEKTIDVNLKVNEPQLPKSMTMGLQAPTFTQFGASSQQPQMAQMPAPLLAAASQGASQQNTNITQNINGTGNPSLVANEVLRQGGFGMTTQQAQPGIFSGVAQ